jgi:hypothetical protein
MEKKFILVGVFLVFIIITGQWLSRTGRPLNTLLLTIHKLISLAGVVFLVVTLYRLNQTAPLSPLEITLSGVTVLLFAALIVTGGLLSTTKVWPGIVLRIHQVVPTLVILSTAVNLYLLHGRKV